ncbi:hypothetical protein PVAND_002497 [Polypedilum vanderplanki]|uniref:Uncharacterized protein n=1 Tax=Polypedilum vanderplanki TaxID=319348 RepID=A0A9J6BRU7_POLVA|nr:hypothetical protein PVAND_002497 [Polypedilum vanderplanki]
MGLRLLLLLVVGLGALYTIHLLAQDYMKISAGSKVAARLLFGKRDLSNLSRNITQEEIEFEEKIDWDKVLKRDPFSCALSLICQLAAGAEKENQDANGIYELITNSIENKMKLPKKLIKAYEQGQEFNKNEKDDYKKCYKNYSWCPYSASTMMKFIAFNKVLFG